MVAKRVFGDQVTLFKIKRRGQVFKTSSGHCQFSQLTVRFKDAPQNECYDGHNSKHRYNWVQLESEETSTLEPEPVMIHIDLGVPPVPFINVVSGPVRDRRNIVRHSTEVISSI